MKKIIIAFLALSIAAISCKKPIENSITKKSRIPTKQKTRTNMPTISNGILKFNSFNDLESFLIYINDIQKVNEDDSINSYDTDPLENLEQSWGYTSFRKFEDDYIETQTESVANPELIADIDYIKHPGYKFVFNRDKNLIVANEFYHYFSKDYIVKINSTNTNLLTEFTSLKNSGNTLSQIFAAYSKPDLLDVLPSNFGMIGTLVGYTELNKKDRGVFVFTKPIASVIDPCHNPTYTAFEKFKLVDVDGANSTMVDPYLTIEWGDGTTQSGIIPFSSTVTHTFPTVGTYHIRIYYKSADDPNYPSNPWVGYYDYDYTISTPCDNGGKDYSKTWKYSSDGNRAMSFENGTKISFWNGHLQYWGETKGWKKISGNFKHRKLDRLVVQLWCDITDNSCVQKSPDASSTWPYDCKTASVCTQVGELSVYFKWYKLTGEHRFLYSSNYITHITTLFACQ